MAQENTKGLGETLVEIYEKLDKYVGILAAIIAALTFAEGNRWVSYGFVLIGYCLFATFLWRMITGKSPIRSVIVTPFPHPARQEFDFPRTHRIIAAVALVLLTILSAGWIGVNGWQDLQRLASPVDEPKGPAVTILTEKPTPEAASMFSPTAAISSTSTHLSPVSLTRFAGEEIAVYDCIVGESKSTAGSIWVVTARPQEFRVGAETFRITDTPRTDMESLLLAPTRIVVNRITLFIDEYSPPVQPSQIQLYAILGCGMGGGPVQKAQFEDVVLRPSQSRYLLNAQTTQLPYYLGEGEALHLAIPLHPSEPGAYLLHLEADVVGFSGESVRIQSAPVSYRSIHLEMVNAKDLVLR